MRILLTLFWNAGERRLRCFWRLLLQCIVMFPSIIAAAIALGLIAMLLDAGADTFMSMQAVSQNLLVTGIVAFACIWPDRRTIRSLGLRLTRRWWIDCAGGFVLGAALMTAIFLFEWSMGWITVALPVISPVEMFAAQGNWLVAMLFVGIGEEVLSRGHHLKNLCEGFRFLGVAWSVILASLLSSCFFALFHVFNPAATVVSGLAVCMAGVMLCVGRLATGSLAAPIGMHFSWNYFQGGVFGFPVSGQRMSGNLIETTQYGVPFWTGGEFGPEAGMLGLLAVIAGTLAFIYWPRPESKLMASVVEVTKLQRRRKRQAMAVASHV